MDKDYLIEKWLKDELTTEEKNAFEALDDLGLNQAIIENAQYFKASSFSEPVDFETFKKHLASKKPNSGVRWMTPFMRIAALLVAGLGIYFLFFFNNPNTVSTLASEKTTIELPDTSEVILNALSTLSYNQGKWNRKREVSLQGEAFFKVAQGKVFDVLTKDGTVTVVGTQFNVKQRDNFFEVKCYEGIVRVTAGTTMKELTVGDSFRLIDGTLRLFETLHEQPQWTQNTSSFKAVPFKEVVAELERQYGVKVVMEDNSFNPEFTGGFVHGDLDSALKSITQPLELTHIIEPNNQVRLQKRE